VHFFKTSGCGNDFLALVEPTAMPNAAEIAAWCRRGVSLGADGLFILRRAASDPAAAIEMDYFNADGGAAELCVNGTRCAARLAFELGWADDETVIRTGAGPIRARPAGPDEIEIDLPAPPPPRAVEADGVETWHGEFVTVGVPHFVVFWNESLADAPVHEAGPHLRRHPAFGPAGANVNFARFVSPSRLELRTYERGVEAETLACGSGVLAATRAGLHRGVASLPLVALTSGGYELRVREAPAGGWSLTGDARILASGTLQPAASSGPRPARFSA
jgi:diaminopimelate epimerase